MYAHGQIAEYSEIIGQSMQTKTILRTETKTLYRNAKRTYELTHCSAGWTSAGSMARYVANETFAVLFYCGGSVNGRHFNTLAEAEEMLAIWMAA